MSTIPEIIGPRNLASLPDGETLSTAQDLDVRVVTAVFNGAGAAGSFLACVSHRAPDGTLIGRFFPSQVFAIGDSGEVTFGPFLESGAGATPSGGGVAEAANLFAYLAAGGNVPASTWTAPSFDGSTWGSAQITTSNTFGISIDTTTGIITVSQNATVQATGWVQWNGAFNVGDVAAVAITEFAGVQVLNAVPIPNSNAIPERKISVSSPRVFFGGPSSWRLNVWHNSALAQSIRDCGLQIVVTPPTF